MPGEILSPYTVPLTLSCSSFLCAISFMYCTSSISFFRCRSVSHFRCFVITVSFFGRSNLCLSLLEIGILIPIDSGITPHANVDLSGTAICLFPAMKGR